MNVGQVVSLDVQDGLVLDSVERILEDPKELGELAKVTYDERMSPERWRAVLNLELLLLLKWSATRLLSGVRGGTRPPLIGAKREVLVLLPSYGYVLHGLRRAVPFAALGLRTIVSVPPACLRDAAPPITTLARAIGLDATLSVSDQPPPQLVAHGTRSKRPIFITGRLATWKRLRRQHPDSQIYGATGTCSIIISTDASLAEALEMTLGRRQLPTSCSNHGLTIVCDAYPQDGEEAAQGSASQATTASTSRVVRQVREAHPSIILAIEKGEAREAIPAAIAGYAVFRCDLDGSPDSLAGFARDPVCGWPGDYYV
jgi:hypothetical protein